MTDREAEDASADDSFTSHWEQVSRMFVTTVDQLNEDSPLGAPQVDLVVSDNLTEVDMSEYDALQREAELKALAIKNDIYSAEHERIRQQKRHRTWFFYWSLAVITVVILSSGGMYFWHMKATGGEPKDVVIIGWLTTTLVEVVGLGYIIAHSLFQSSNGDTAASSRSLHLPRRSP